MKSKSPAKASKPRKTGTKRTSRAAKIELLPGDVYLAHPDEVTRDASLLRRALAIHCTDATLAEQIKREMRLPVYADLTEAQEAARAKRGRMNGRVAAVVPNYNYGRFIHAALDALVSQTRRPDEIIVVDDASTDDSANIVNDFISRHPQSNVRLIKHDRNTGNVGGPRNTGIAATDAEFIVCLDSDDLLELTYIETLYNVINGHHELGVVYSGVQTQEDLTGGERRLWPGWPPEFKWEWQVSTDNGPVRNCIPVASMFRREMWERCGGYDAGRTAAEDVDFWVRGLSVGFEAKKVTAEPLFVYRRHSTESMSQRKILRMDTWSIAYRGHLPLAAPHGRTPTLRDYTKPAVSVIIPVGPGHADKLPSAIHSVVAQTFTNWEIVVVNDSAEALPLAAYPFVRVVRMDRRGSGAGAARNVGLRAAYAPLVFFLDADDFILPRTLELMMRRYAEGDAGYVYSGWWKIEQGQKPQEKIPEPYQPMVYNHPVSVLMATADALRIDGFDESMEAFEDWDFFVKAGVMGICGARVPEALLGYRMATGERRMKGLAMQAQIREYIKAEHGDYIEGRKQVMACCGGNNAATTAALQDGQRRTLPHVEADGTVMLRYVGIEAGGITYFGKYTGCATCEPVAAQGDDVQRLLDTGKWALVKDEMPSIPQPAVIYPLDPDANTNTSLQM